MLYWTSAAIGTFISEEIAEKFSDKVKRSAVVSVSSVNADTTNETIAIEGLVVRGTKKLGEKYLTPDVALPTTFSKPKIFKPFKVRKFSMSENSPRFKVRKLQTFKV